MTAARIGALAFAIFASIGMAQETAPVILSVSVADQTGAIITKAGVRATDPATGKWYDVAADANGHAEIRLARGTYTLRVQAPGFKTWQEKSVEVKESMSKSVMLPYDERDSGYPGPVVACGPCVPVEWQPLDGSIALIPLKLLDLPAKPVHHGFHL